ncbi:MAG TPA: serine peptidase [Parvularcula sp.]|nr:serine peptidase [Parvularcula sp.]
MSQLLNTPLAILPAKAAMLVAALRSQFNITALVMLEDGETRELDAAGLDALAFSGRASGRRDRPEKIYQVDNRMALLPVTGTLMRTWGTQPFSGATGYDGIKERLVAAQNDPDVDGIFMDIDSTGGQVAGCFDCVDLIREMNGRNGGKPVYAIANEDAYSAAFAIASAADHIYVPRTGGTGSVGVITLHADMSKAYEKAGVKVTVIRSGADKAKGNPYEALDDGTLAAIQAEIDEMRELFIETVAAGRKGVSAKKIRETEARTFMGKHAVEIGFADTVASYEQAYVDAHMRMRKRRKIAA